jgi:hypothetical protein
MGMGFHGFYPGKMTGARVLAGQAGIGPATGTMAQTGMVNYNGQTEAAWGETWLPGIYILSHPSSISTSESSLSISGNVAVVT